MKAISSLFLFLACIAVQPSIAQTPAGEISKTVKALVQAVRNSKDDAATLHFAAEEQGHFLLATSWTKGTNEQRNTFTRLFQSLFRKIAFPKIRENLKDLSFISYDDPQVMGDKATVGSVITIDHPLKKQEMKLKYSLVKTKTGWKIFDVAVLGSSMLSGVRDDQVQPLLKEGGWVKLLDAMQKKDAELK